MTEAHAPEPSLSIVPPRFNRLPYCNPEHPNSNTLDILSGYDPDAIASQPDFLNYLSDAYEDEKAGEPSSEEEAYSGPTLDLRDPDHLEGMISHTLAHSITGLIRAGTSDTNCIPYWDREAVSAGLAYQDPENAAQRLALVDALSINALRTCCYYLCSLPLSCVNQLGLIEHAMSMGRRSKKDIRPSQEAEKARIKVDYARHVSLDADLYAAKLKHLLLLIDQQPEPEVRRRMQPELGKFVMYAADIFCLPPKDLVVDMGVDTGISEASARPRYDISMFMQLKHQFEPGKEKTYVLPQSKCHRLSVGDLLTSIDRPDHDPPFYEDGRYRLPFRFDNG